MTLKAVLWDFDGTLVDTEPIWCATEQRIVSEYGVTWTDEDVRAKVGQHAEITARQIAEAVGEPERLDYWYDELHRQVAEQIASNDLPYLPGVRSLIEELALSGVRMAVVTASNGVIIDAARSRLPKHFEFIITSDDVTRTKPDPQPYQMALDRMGVDAGDALILEDSVPGTKSALGTGAVVVAFPVMQQLEPHPRLRVRPEGPKGLTLEMLTQIWRELRHL